MPNRGSTGSLKSALKKSPSQPTFDERPPSPPQFEASVPKSVVINEVQNEYSRDSQKFKWASSDGILGVDSDTPHPPFPKKFQSVYGEDSQRFTPLSSHFITPENSNL